MKTKFFASILLVVLCFTTQAQDVNIPDANFLKALISSGVDTNYDGKIQFSEASAVKTNIDLSSRGISDLTGIEAFPNWISLNCSNNQIKTLDVSKITIMTYLNCSNNQISSLNIGKNAALTSLFCRNNQLSVLDVSKNTALTQFDCSNNQLNTLDVSKNTTLTYLSCNNNLLGTLDVSKNISLNSLNLYVNPLKCLSFLPKSISVIRKDQSLCLPNLPNNTFSCQNSNGDPLPKILCTEVYNTQNQCTTYPTVSGRIYVDVNKDKKYTQGIDNPLPNTRVSSLIETNTDAFGNYSFRFDNLNQTYTIQPSLPNGYLSIPISDTVSFKVMGEVRQNKDFIVIPLEVYIPDPNFLNALISNGVDKNKDKKIQNSEAEVVTSLGLSYKNISNLTGIEAFTKLKQLNCSNNNLSTLDVSNNSALTGLDCSFNKLSTLDVSKNAIITTLNCSNNQLSILDVSANSVLNNLYCVGNQLSTLEVNKNTSLILLECSSNQLQTLDISRNTSLANLKCRLNQLSALEVSNNTDLIILDCSDNQLSTLDVSKNNALIDLQCFNNQLSALDVSNTVLTKLNCSSNQLSTLDVSKNTALTHLWCSSNKLINLNFGKVSALQEIDLVHNQLSTLDISNFTALTVLNCFNNTLIALDVSKNTLLSVLACDKNQLSILDVSKNTFLNSLSCSNNQLRTLDLSKSKSFTRLDCSNNQLRTIDVSKSTSLTYLYCSNNQLSALDVRNNTSLDHLNCRNNQLKNIDVGKKGTFMRLICFNNPLKCLSFLPDSIILQKDPSLCLPNIPNIIYCEDSNYNSLPIILCSEAYNASNQCNSYPNTSGRIYVDVNKDKQYTQGTDYPMSNVGINTTYETNSDAFGQYGFKVDNLNQTYTIQPVLPAGWLSTPISDTISFKTMGEVREGKDFIVSPPVLNDVWVEASPVTFARPGFVVKYQVKVKNLGGTAQSSTVQLNYPTNFEFKSSSPAGNNLNTTHTWSANNLVPFEERIFTIEFTLSPETPLGTELLSTATVSIPDDGNLANNVSEIKQTVRGSYDPNDKLLNKGNTVLRSSIQAQEDFVYTIRFQNTGTDTAFRVIVRDTLALNKFDLKSMQTIASSHPYTLKYEGNFLNWTFNDILLPDSTTDKVGSNGFVKFKIKPLSTLAVDEEINNKAAIYFDFNKAVITNTVNTRVSNTTNISESTIPSTQVFPNPSSGLFTIRGVNDALVQVLNTTGAIIHTQNISENDILDLRTAAKGIYCLKIQTATKTEMSKVVVE